MRAKVNPMFKCKRKSCLSYYDQLALNQLRLLIIKQLPLKYANTINIAYTRIVFGKHFFWI